jgi:hypothetical protein
MHNFMFGVLHAMLEELGFCEIHGELDYCQE